jgi:hypothetical protein
LFWVVLAWRRPVVTTDSMYVRDADNAGLNDIAQFFRDVMAEDS